MLGKPTSTAVYSPFSSVIFLYRAPVSCSVKCGILLSQEVSEGYLSSWDRGAPDVPLLPFAFLHTDEVDSFRQILEFVLFLPLNLIPIFGTPAFL